MSNTFKDGDRVYLKWDNSLGTVDGMDGSEYLVAGLESHGFRLILPGWALSLTPWNLNPKRTIELTLDEDVADFLVSRPDDLLHADIRSVVREIRRPMSQMVQKMSDGDEAVGQEFLRIMVGQIPEQAI